MGEKLVLVNPGLSGVSGHDVDFIVPALWKWVLSSLPHSDSGVVVENHVEQTYWSNYILYHYNALNLLIVWRRIWECNNVMH